MAVMMDAWMDVKFVIDQVLVMMDAWMDVKFFIDQVSSVPSKFNHSNTVTFQYVKKI